MFWGCLPFCTADARALVLGSFCLEQLGLDPRRPSYVCVRFWHNQSELSCWSQVTYSGHLAVLKSEEVLRIVTLENET
jgi:hypothetical protein